MKLIELPATGIEHGLGHGPDGCSMVSAKTYAPTQEGQHLRELRKARRLYLWQGADVLGISVAEMSGLERGRFSVEDWAVAFQVIAASGEGDADDR